MTYIMGDTHGNFNLLNYYTEFYHPDNIIICGDFGYWEKFSITIDKIVPNSTKIYWVAGNHECWDLIETNFGRVGKVPIEIKENIFYCPIGSNAIIENKKYLFIGGADSIDKSRRTPYVDWFPQEVLNQSDFYWIMENSNLKVDYVITHTCPHNLTIKVMYKNPGNLSDKCKDPTGYLLDSLIDQGLHPEKWFFGHWHYSHTFYYGKIKFILLSHIEDNFKNEVYYKIEE